MSAGGYNQQADQIGQDQDVYTSSAIAGAGGALLTSGSIGGITINAEPNGDASGGVQALNLQSGALATGLDSTTFEPDGQDHSDHSDRRSQPRRRRQRRRYFRHGGRQDGLGARSGLDSRRSRGARPADGRRRDLCGQRLEDGYRDNSDLGNQLQFQQSDRQYRGQPQCRRGDPLRQERQSAVPVGRDRQDLRHERGVQRRDQLQ